ncbi:hypothetical protein SD70_31960 [Gordoniibacillus kamchatkensis]|uniref:Integrase n=1 Tax=Gordoniibacillus kamchatkensis TaxID=1590651 RepID=A0ABR5A3V3_9BACL|nr:tyrosine-type recombinase/integrase [Paenibacillus sp. VKM B-2647]KIL35732.1 hypothetical protein SD70_31960 [Paenibacillus sp. VKM B-2647]
MKKSRVQLFFEYLKSNKSDITVKNYLHTLKLFAEWLSTNRGDIEAPTRHDVSAFIDAMKNGTDGTGRKKSAATLNARFAGLKAYAEFIGRPDICDDITIPKAPKLKDIAPKSLNSVDRNALLRDVEAGELSVRPGSTKKTSTRYVAIVNLLVRAGLRISELVALDIDDVTITPRSGHIDVRDGKGNKSRRVPLSPKARYWIARYMEERRGIDADTPALFLSNYKQRISVRIIQERLQKYGVHPHMLRHTFAADLVNEKGAPITAVAELLGHSDIAVTNRYSKPTAEKLAELIDLD